MCNPSFLQVDISMYWPQHDCKEHDGQSPLIVTFQKLTSGDSDIKGFNSLDVSILISIPFKLEYRNKFHLVTFLRSPTSQEWLVVLRICREHFFLQPDTWTWIPMCTDKELNRMTRWISVFLDLIFTRLMFSTALFNWPMLTPHLTHGIPTWPGRHVGLPK